VGSTDGGMRGPDSAPTVGSRGGSDRSPSEAAPGAAPAAPVGDAQPRSKPDSGEHRANRPSAKPPATGPQPDLRRVTVNPGSPPPRIGTSPAVPTPAGPAHLPAPSRPGHDDASGPRRARPAPGPGGWQWRTVIAVVVALLVLAGAAVAAVVLSDGDYGAGGASVDSASRPDTTAAAATEATRLTTGADPLDVRALS
jgi:hypothetical protein